MRIQCLLQEQHRRRRSLRKLVTVRNSEGRIAKNKTDIQQLRFFRQAIEQLCNLSPYALTVT